MLEKFPIQPGDTDLCAALKRSLNERARDQAFRERRRTLVGASHCPCLYSDSAVRIQYPLVPPVLCHPRHTPILSATPLHFRLSPCKH